MIASGELVAPAFTDQEIRTIADGRSSAIAEWTRSTASACGISPGNRPNDGFVRAISRLSDGAVDLDPVEELLVELGRAGVITPFQRGLLQVHYLR